MKPLKKMLIAFALGVLMGLILIIGVIMYFLKKIVEILEFVLEKHNEFADDFGYILDDLVHWIEKIVENHLKI